jgi:BirA family biotin operon repressor/biotin-[acetyl-CoA-carboxylase] ligase
MKQESHPSCESDIRVDRIEEGLRKSPFTKNIIFLKKIDSTNTLTKQLAAKGAPEGTLVLADEQTAGRGRMGRQWYSPKGVNLYFSILLRPAFSADQVFTLTMILALASIDAVKMVNSLDLVIKWPNDLYFNGKKIGGILTEFLVRDGKFKFAIVGLGLNVNWHPKTDESTIYLTTSISNETGLWVSREKILMELLRAFEKYYEALQMGQVDEIHKQWIGKAMFFGKRVEIVADDHIIVGKAQRLDTDGALIILDEQGNQQKIRYGDVSVREI